MLEVLCLALNIYHEARGESIEGQIAVAQVTMNRVESEHFPGTVCGVVWQPYQFSWTLEAPLPVLEPDSWLRAAHIAHQVYSGCVRPLVGTSLHYHADYVSPNWASKLEYHSKIGAHIFYEGY